MMQQKFLESQECYNGSQLVSLRNYLIHGLLGDSVVAWTGACDVSIEHMVDGEDLLENSRICGGEMLHFIIEKFDVSLFAAVTLQRLFAGIVRDQLVHFATNQELAQKLHREGDDLFCDQRKLSISIATQSPVSSLIHFAVNIVNTGTPVPTLSLGDLGVEPKQLAVQCMRKLGAELKEIHQATHKVRWVK